MRGGTKVQKVSELRVISGGEKVVIECDSVNDFHNVELPCPVCQPGGLEIGEECQHCFGEEFMEIDRYLTFLAIRNEGKNGLVVSIAFDPI